MNVLTVGFICTGLAILAWSFWRLNETPKCGEWNVKIAVLLVFCATSIWLFDAVTGNEWRADGLFLLASIAIYLWWGVWRHLRADRRAPNSPRCSPATLDHH